MTVIWNLILKEVKLLHILKYAQVTWATIETSLIKSASFNQIYSFFYVSLLNIEYLM